jgi:predicted nucleotidyltransferase
MAASTHYPDLTRIAPVIERLSQALAPEEIWLFGSQAEGRARPDSDYDLLAVLPDDAHPSALDVVAAWELVRGLRVPVDVVPCTRSEFDDERDEIDSLPRAAWQRGVCVYMSVPKRIRSFLDLVADDLAAADVLARAQNRNAAYHAQQAVEKLLKSLLLHAGLEAGTEHRLDVLLDRLPADHAWRTELLPLLKYGVYATTFRYPTPGGRISSPPPFAEVLADLPGIGALRERAVRELLSPPG